MCAPVCISIIVPFFNSEGHLERCLKGILGQDFRDSFEVILVDDGSSDSSRVIAERYASMRTDVRVFSLSVNSGPGAARNVGLAQAIGKYLLFLDADDTIQPSLLRILYGVAEKDKSDLVICDKERVENSINQRKCVFLYPKDRVIEKEEIVKAMRRRYFDPITSMGLFGLTGRLIRRALVLENRITFEESLRYWEDETFSWDLLAHVKSISYVHQQLYTYHVNPNANTGVSAGFGRPFPVANFKVTREHIKHSLRTCQFPEEEVNRLADQGFIYFIISAFVSFSRSLVLGKVDVKEGRKARRKMINEILEDPEVGQAILNYQTSKQESQWIPRAIVWRWPAFLELACTLRARRILYLRRQGKV